MKREELTTAAEALLNEAPLAHPAYVHEARRAEWMNQLIALLDGVVAHTDAWGLLPPIDRDASAPGADNLGVTLCFVDACGLYRVILYSSDGHLVARVERMLLSRLRVTLVENRKSGELSRVWQFTNEDDAFNLTAYEGPNSTEFLHELVRRVGWPLS